VKLAQPLDVQTTIAIDLLQPVGSQFALAINSCGALGSDQMPEVYPIVEILGTLDGEDLVGSLTNTNLIYGDGIGRFDPTANTLIAGNDTANGGAANDLLVGDFQQIEYWGDGAPRTVILGDDVIFGGDGDDVIHGGSSQALLPGLTVIGGNDQLYGGNGNDTIFGGGGDDQFYGGSGNDLIFSGTGNNTVDGGAGADTLNLGHSGATIVDMAMGQSWSALDNNTFSNLENIVGSSGGDWIKADSGNNQLDGHSGDDVIYGGDGNDVISGDDDNDALYGETGNDTIFGGNGVDYIEGGEGADLIIDATTVEGEWSALHGGAGNDELRSEGNGVFGLWGDEGDDTFVFGSGSAHVYGGAGADTYTFGAETSAIGANFAQIYDFDLGLDLIETNGTVAVAEWGEHTGILITQDNGALETMMLMGVQSDQLASSNWLFNS